MNHIYSALATSLSGLEIINIRFSFTFALFIMSGSENPSTKSPTVSNQKIELLAPGGDVEAIKAAIVAGADAVYCGLELFNARNRATNISFEELTGLLRLAHEHSCQIFLTLNVVILEQELPALFKLLNQLVNSTIDGIIVQDLGLFNIVRKHFPTLDIHASTQMTTLNEGQLFALKSLGASRVNLSRELNIDEIKTMSSIAHQQGLLTEVFVHGSLCIAFSGQCYSSSVSVGNSGNRGRCSQACRDEYEITDAGNRFPLNLKDNSAYFDLPQLIDAGVDSVKIEGRIKGAHYVYTVVDSWRKQINQFEKTGTLLDDDKNLRMVFNRDFTNSFLTGNLSKDMFIDDPRDHSAKGQIAEQKAVTIEHIGKVRTKLRDDRNIIGMELADKIESLSIAKIALRFEFTGSADLPLQIKVSSSLHDFTVASSIPLRAVENTKMDQVFLEKRFKSFNNAKFTIGGFDFNGLQSNLGLPFKAITELKHKVAFELNDCNAVVAQIDVPALPNHPKTTDSAKLSILICDEADIYLADKTDADVYFKLPESLKKGCDKFINILLNNPRLIPWFPAVLIGKDYDESVRILEVVRPPRIVSNNTGVAFQAVSLGIEWTAGPFLNTTNSYALLTLKEDLKCSGAFISNEINRRQIQTIKRPDNFKLAYSIYHPILMMTSRQCFFQQTVGCKKPTIEDGCMLKCKKATTITNVKGVSFAIDKQRGGYPSIYNDEQFYNPDAVSDLKSQFDEFFIDLTDIGSGSKEVQDKTLLIQYFEDLLKEDTDASGNLHNLISSSTNTQYQQGL